MWNGLGGRFRAVIYAPTVSLALAMSALSPTLWGQEVRLLSTAEGLPISVSAAGDSCSPILSGNGRWLLFASSANNLCRASNGSAFTPSALGVMNVYLHDLQFGTNELISADVAGTSLGNADSLPSGISSDGRLVLLESQAGNLILGDTNNASDIFQWDNVARQMVLVSAAVDGGCANGNSHSAVMTPDGRYVAFVSVATNLVARDTNYSSDIFVRDLQSQSTFMASADLPVTSTRDLQAPELSADGRWVAFFVTQTNNSLLSFQPGEIYVYDRQSNNTRQISADAHAILGTNTISAFNYLFSADSAFIVYEAAAAPGQNGVILRFALLTGQTDLIATNASLPASAYDQIHNVDLSADGRFVAFVANSNSIDGSTTCIKVVDTQNGTAIVASADLNNSVPARTVADFPRFDVSGRFISFISNGTNLSSNAKDGEFHVYLKDLQTGSLTLVDTNSLGQGVGVSPVTAPKLSGDGQKVAFESLSSSLVANDLNRSWDVFVRQADNGGMELISTPDPSLPGSSVSESSIATSAAVSGDGQFVVFATDADNLVANDTNGYRDVVVKDLASGTIRLVSVATNGTAADGASSEPSISGDGRHVVFLSTANNLAPRVSNHVQYLYLGDLQTGTVALVPGSTNPVLPQISSDGAVIVYKFSGNALPPGIRAFFPASGITLSLLTGDGQATLTPDGRSVAVCAVGISNAVVVWQLNGTPSRASYDLGAVVRKVALSADGQQMACWAGTTTTWQLSLVNRQSGARTVIATSAAIPNPVLQFSSNGVALAYTAMSNAVKGVYRYDLIQRVQTLVSHTWSSGGPATNGISDAPAISPDGRFIAFRSSATNLVSGDVNNQPDIFLYDGLSGATIRLTDTAGWMVAGQNALLTPAFSGDGSLLIFSAVSQTSQGGTLPPQVFGRNFLIAVLQGANDPGGPWVSWTWEPGKTYGVQYKNTLDETVWHTLNATSTNSGVKAWMHDSSLQPQRFYRILAY